MPVGIPELLFIAMVVLLIGTPPAILATLLRRQRGHGRTPGLHR